MGVRELPEQHLGLARREARRWAHVPIEQEELEQEGALGLVRAARRFDPSRGVPFDAYALPFVRGAILTVLRDRARRDRSSAGGYVRLVEIDAVREPRGAPLELEDTGPAVEDRVEARRRLRLVAGLPARERHVLIRTEVDGAPAAVVAGELGVSVHRVYAIAYAGARRLRRRAA